MHVRPSILSTSVKRIIVDQHLHTDKYTSHSIKLTNGPGRVPATVSIILTDRHALPMTVSHPCLIKEKSILAQE